MIMVAYNRDCVKWRNQHKQDFQPGLRSLNTDKFIPQYTIVINFFLRLFAEIPQVIRQWNVSMFIIGAAIFITILAGTTVYAAEDKSLSLTIYNDDLALVEDIRSLDIQRGRSRIEFKDVSAMIRPETVDLTATGISIVEQNFDFDLLTPAKLMEKAVGQEVEIVRINPGSGEEITETATVLAVNNGVVLKIGERIEVLRADGIPTRVIFDKVPENLRARPTLSVTVDSSRSGKRDTTLRYLTTGLSWQADYVALFDEPAGKLDLLGWVTLTNQSGTTYDNANTQLVAGEINLTRDFNDYQRRYQQRQRNTVRRGGMEVGEQQPVADYYVYPLDEPTTIADNQTKQVSFIEAEKVTARKAYEYRARWFQTEESPQHADVVVQFSNNTRAGLGAQLPAGVVRVYVRDVEGKPKFVGEDQIEHTSQGSELSIKTGEAFDITVQPTLLRHERVSLIRSRYSMEYLVRNARAQAATVEIRQRGWWRDVRVLEESIPNNRIDAYTFKWDVPVASGGETKLTFTIEAGW